MKRWALANDGIFLERFWAFIVAYSQDRFEDARSSARPVFIEFTADWCINCKVLEKTTYADSKFIEAVQRKRVISFRVDMTEFDEGK